MNEGEHDFVELEKAELGENAGDENRGLPLEEGAQHNADVPQAGDCISHGVNSTQISFLRSSFAPPP